MARQAQDRREPIEKQQEQEQRALLPVQPSD
jgi:hypothetical protein